MELHTCAFNKEFNLKKEQKFRIKKNKRETNQSENNSVIGFSDRNKMTTISGIPKMK
jgi:hypothetical protein